MISPSFASNALFLSLEVCPKDHVSSLRGCCCQSANMADSRRGFEGLSLPLLDRLTPDLVLVLIEGSMRLVFELSNQNVSFHSWSVILVFGRECFALSAFALDVDDGAPSQIFLFLQPASWPPTAAVRMTCSAIAALLEITPFYSLWGRPSM
jgi:hypothetical protein